MAAQVGAPYTSPVSLHDVPLLLLLLLLLLLPHRHTHQLRVNFFQLTLQLRNGLRGKVHITSCLCLNNRAAVCRVRQQ
jgi:hypothetical protein